MYHIINLSGSIFPVKARHGLEGYGMAAIEVEPTPGGDMENDEKPGVRDDEVRLFLFHG